MSVLFHDGRRYEAVEFQKEEDFESFCVSHATSVFWAWEESGVALYVSEKPRLTSRTGRGAVPDGYLLWLDESPEYSCLSLVEYEMASHSVDEHVIPQLIRFQASLDSRETQTMLEELFRLRLDALLRTARFRRAYSRTPAQQVLASLTRTEEAVGLIVVTNGDIRDLAGSMTRIHKHAPWSWVLEVQALADAATSTRRKLKPGTRVFARYPESDGEWYLAKTRRAVSGGYLVDWQDRDRSNRRVDRAVRLADLLPLVREVAAP